MRVQVATEVLPGDGTAPTTVWYGDLRLGDEKQSQRRAEKTRRREQYRRQNVGRMRTIRGSYSDDLTFEGLAIYPRYALKPPGTPTSDGNGTPGYSTTHKLVTGREYPDTFAVEHGNEAIPMFATMGFWDGFTISGNVDGSEESWQWASQAVARDNSNKATTSGTATGGSSTTVVKAAAGWTVNAFAGRYVIMRSGTNIGEARPIVSNDATTLTVSPAFPAAVVNTDTFEISGAWTASIADRTEEKVPMAGTKLYIDTYGGTIGTTVRDERLIAFSLEVRPGLKTKRFANDTTAFSKKLGLGMLDATLSITLENDDWLEEMRYYQDVLAAIRIQSIGSVIDSGAGSTKIARIDVPRWDLDSIGDLKSRNGNLTRELKGPCLLDDTAASSFTLLAKHKMAALP